ncbi:MAG: fimbrial protein [Aeromonas sp.]
MKKIFACTLIALGCMAGTAQAATLEFTGSVNAPTCDIAPEVVGPIDLGAVSISKLGTAVPFALKPVVGTGDCDALTAEHTATLAWSGDFTAEGLINPAATAADSVLILTATNGSDVNAVTTGALTNTLLGDELTSDGFAYTAQLQGGVKPGDFTATATYTVTYQ